VRARSRYQLIVSRGGHGPAFLARRDRMDHVEVVSIDEGEVVFFWDLPPRRARSLVRALREDLGAMDADEFLTAWRLAAEEGR
jgi:hypothetical protein